MARLDKRLKFDQALYQRTVRANYSVDQSSPGLFPFLQSRMTCSLLPQVDLLVSTAVDLADLLVSTTVDLADSLVSTAVDLADLLVSTAADLADLLVST